MATPKQAALLQFLGIHPPASTSDASSLIDEVISDPDYSVALEKWKFERLWLHPTLYAKEFELFRSTRVSRLLDANNNQRGPGCPLRVLTAAQVQTVVDWLDANHPTWDRYFCAEYGGVNLEMFGDGFIPLAAQLLPNVVKRGYEHINSQTAVF